MSKANNNSLPDGKIMLAWCDNGTSDGKFTEGLVYTVLQSKYNGIPILGAVRVQGNQIGRQREQLFNSWHKNTDFDWLLWVDSDIVLTEESLKKVWDSVHVKDRPIVSGTYFISKETEQSVMMPHACLFMEDDSGEDYVMKWIHPLPFNQLMKVDYAGFGFLLMHRSVADRMREFHGDIPLFMETAGSAADNKDTFIGEDIQFFMKMKQAGIPLHAHTGATVKHMKRFSFDEDYYKLYWITHIASQAHEKKAEA
jgi:hypothetical protein